MTVGVRSSADPGVALDAAGPYLRAEPVRNNLVLSLLAQRLERPEGGRYWWATEASHVVGFVFQSPVRFRALVSAAGPEVVDALVEAVAHDSPGLPGVMGEAATAARFAGQWAERRRAPVVPTEGQRLYRLGTVRPPVDVPGHLRGAEPRDRDELVGWAADFVAATGGHPLHPADIVDRHMDDGRLWLWDDGGPASLAAVSSHVAGVVRVAFVYTPPEHRRRGYAAACVAAVSADVAGAGQECLLYAQLQNPTSNAVYRRIGYEPVVDVLIYRFGGALRKSSL